MDAVKSGEPGWREQIEQVIERLLEEASDLRNQFVYVAGIERCADKLAELLTGADPAPAAEQETEKRIREYLWLSHGHKGIYGDDGEMQCAECAPFGAWDYKREPLPVLLDTLHKMGTARVVAVLADSAPATAPAAEPPAGTVPHLSGCHLSIDSECDCGAVANGSPAYRAREEALRPVAEPPAGETPRPQDTYRWGEVMPQFAVLGIGPEAWADLMQAERHAHEHRTTDRSPVSVKWGTFRLVMTVLRAIRLADFERAALSSAPASETPRLSGDGE
jgi:hypothetical protein